MSVRKSNDKWYIHGWYTLDDGSKRNYHKLAKNCKLKKEAEYFESQFLLNVSRLSTDVKGMTLKELSALYLRDFKSNVKATTYVDTERIINKFNVDLGNTLLYKLEKKHVQNYLDNLYETYSFNFVEKVFYCFNKLFTYGVKNEYLEKNFMPMVTKRHDKNILKNEMLFWTSEQFQIFKSNYQGSYETLLFISFLYYMGCRRGEALSLQWKDINLETKKIRIYKTVAMNINGIPWVLTPPKTKNSNRIITMPDILVDMLRVQYSKHFCMSNGNPSEVFIFGYDRPAPPETIRRGFNSEIARINTLGYSLPRIRIHDLRHSHASYLISNKVYDYDIAKRLGDTVDTLHNVYAHWFENAEKDIIDILNSNFN